MLDSLQLGLDAFLQVDNDPLTWQRKEDGSYTTTATEIERLALFHFSSHFGLFKYGQIGLQVPVYLDNGRGPESKGGVGDLRLVPKVAYQFNIRKVVMGISATVPIGFPTGDETEFLGEGQLVVEPTLGIDLDLGRVLLVGNGAALIKDGEERHGLPRGKELRGGIGANINLLPSGEQLQLIAEVMVTTMVKDFFSRQSTPVEALAGIMYIFPNGISLSGGLGTSFTAGSGAPKGRLLLNLGVVPKPFGSFEKMPDKASIEESDVPLAPPDADKDGVADKNDFCPNEPEDYDKYDDDDGCPEPDNDGDGIEDVRDQCPQQAETYNQLNDEDGCPEKDNDGDGIPNEIDNCITDAEDMDGYMDKDGCPELNNDNDELADTEDECPQLPESEQQDDDAVIDGCPDSFVLKENQFEFKMPIRFVRKKSVLTKDSGMVLDDLANAIKFNKHWTQISIHVHTSGRGKPEVNKELAEERAGVLLNALINRGVNPDILHAKGKGDGEPLAPATTREGRKQNERVEIRIDQKGDKQ